MELFFLLLFGLGIIALLIFSNSTKEITISIFHRGLPNICDRRDQDAFFNSSSSHDSSKKKGNLKQSRVSSRRKS